MTDIQKAQHIVHLGTLCQMVIDKFDLLKREGVVFRQQLKFHANGVEKECVRIGEWFWNSFGEDGEKEVMQLQDAINTISKVLNEINPCYFDELEQLIIDFKKAKNA